jgi:CheY-like chemotaxis protein
VKNAIKYSDNGSIELGYVLKNDITQTVLEFFVKDTGIGIPKERHSAIFERFVQADISDKRALQGAGLGLAISKAFVEMLGGKIRVESETRKGSAFYFTIPYSTKEIPDLSSESKSSPESKRKEINNLNILIAEDDEISRIFLNKSLKSFSRKILIAKTGNDAIDMVRSQSDIDLILMDIQMPGIDGYEAIRQIRRFNKNVYIIAQTAFALSGDKEKAISAGADAYISKPINIDELHVIINKKFI